MAEAGGTTTQSGIYYQNSISALYLGQLLGGGPAETRLVMRVRAEAPEAVDDTVATFDDGGRDFVQAKENLTSGDVWRKLWNDFFQQLRGDFTPGVDRLLLVIGEPTGRATDLREMARRADGAESDREWLEMLNGDHRDIVTSVGKALPAGTRTQDVYEIFRRLRVEIRTIEDIEEERVALLLPETTKTRRELFSLLRDRVQSQARYRISFTRDELVATLRKLDPGFRITAAPMFDKLRDAIRGCGAALRSQKRTIGPTGRHLPRAATDETVAWLRAAESEGTIAMLLGDAGRGKTVVMAEVLDALEETGTVVLAMKADSQLAVVKNGGDIQRQLELPDSVERVVATLARRAPVVVLVDQIDALSHNLARDAQTLDAVLDMAARLRRISNVRVALSCRTFDRATDRRLRRLDVKKEINVGELTDGEVEQVLESAAVAYDGLSVATRCLLRTPLHLDLFVWLKSSGGTPEANSPAMLQDLYAALLEEVALRLDVDAPPPDERARVLDAMTDFMARHQRASVPMSHIRATAPGSDRATTWLASHDIISVEGSAATFLHQTFFDFLYARQFVQSEESLVAHLAASPQALRQRTELVQILTYARGVDPPRYLRWFDTLWHGGTIGQRLRGTAARVFGRWLYRLWRARPLRPHLRALLTRWFGALRAPTSEEVEWTVKRLKHRSDRSALFDAMSGNVAWFRALLPHLRLMLRDRNDTIVDEVVSLLVRVGAEGQRDVAALLRPYIGVSENWRKRLWWVIHWTRDWKTPEAVELVADVVAEEPPSSFGHFYGFREMAAVHPQGFGRIVRVILGDCAARAESKKEPSFSYLSGAFDHLSQSDFAEGLEKLTADEPPVFLDAVLPWFIETAAKSVAPVEIPQTHRYDYFAFSWRHNFERTQSAIVSGMIKALVAEAAGSATDRFGEHMAALIAAPIASAQWIVGSVYRSVPKLADEALRFLCEDTRRLDLGTTSEITIGIITTAAPSGSPELVAALEAVVLSYRGYRRPETTADLRWVGLEQYRLLAQFPAERLSAAGRHRLAELQRKFPDERTTPAVASGLISRGAATPIPPDRAEKMSDDDWLRAMAKHHDDSDFVRRSPRQLADILKTKAKEDPSRFAALLDRLPGETAGMYVEALVQGLTEDTAPLREAVLNAIRRFAPGADLSLRRVIAWTLQKHPADVPPDILDVLEGWVRDPSLDTVHDAESLDYLNPDRGAAFLALMYALRAQDTPATRERRWHVFTYVVEQDAAFLRAAAIEELRYELFGDAERALDLFEALTAMRSEALAGHYVDDFIRLALGHRAARVLPTIEAAIANQNAHIRERAAYLATIAAVAPAVLSSGDLKWARTLVNTILDGEEAELRTTVARVLAHNIDGPAADYCIARLTSILDDPSDKVRSAIATVFWTDTAAVLLTHRRFLMTYVKSRSIIQGEHMFEDFLLDHVSVDATFGLDLIERALPQLDQAPSPRFGDDLIRYVLRASSAARTDEAFQRRAMDLFDLLDERYGRFSSSLLSEWDRP